MTEKINQELIKLQHELISLQTAAEQLNKAEKASSDVISALRDLHDQYEKSLSDIGALTEEHLNGNKELLSNYLNEILYPHKEELEKTSEKLKLLEISVRQSQAHSADSIKALVVSHEKQIEKMNKVLKKYLDLATSTAKLSDKIDTIDFPANLNRISANISEINGEMRTIKTDISSVNPILADFEKRIKRNNRKINFGLIIGVIAFFVLLLSFVQIALVPYFPEIAEFIKGLLEG